MDIDKEINPLIERPEEERIESIEKREDLAEKQELKEAQPETKKEDIAYTKPVPSDDETNILKEADKVREETVESRQVEHLLQLVQEKGIDFALEVVKKTEDACLLDKFHDLAVEKGLCI